MSAIGEISIRDIMLKYNLGFKYAENIVNGLEDTGYIRKKDEYKYQIIRTENEIDSYIRLHKEEFRPKEYIENDIKDDGNRTFKSKINTTFEYYKIIAPTFIRRILFSIPQAIILFVLWVLLIFAEIEDETMGVLEYIIFYIFVLIVCYIFFAIPLNVIIRILQSKIYKMKFKDFMLLPDNWFFKRCQDTIELHKILINNKINFSFGTYSQIISQIDRILNKKKSLCEHYANLANNAQNENEFYQSINSCISTLEWMVQFEKFGLFPDGHKPSDDISAIKEGMPISIERFNKRMEEMKKEEFNEIKEETINYDIMEGHAFEYFCSELLKKNGFCNVEVTQGSGDHGIDILAEKDGITYAIQCKCYSSNIGNAAVQQAHTGKSLYHKDIAVVLTNRYFTQQAKEEANALGVKLWDRDKLNELISE